LGVIQNLKANGGKQNENENGRENGRREGESIE